MEPHYLTQLLVWFNLSPRGQIGESVDEMLLDPNSHHLHLVFVESEVSSAWQSTVMELDEKTIRSLLQ